MNQYSVLFVDDEEVVLQIMIKKLDWESLGFKCVGYAKNGVEALEMAEDLLPDVVMTDIKMPYMDGLTLCKKLKQIYPKVKLIIFSGFSEFEYAKEAIKSEVEEYILKPIDFNELKEIFLRIKNTLDRELDEKRNIEKLRKYYMESLPILQENFYISLIEGRVSQDSLNKYIKDYQIELTGPYYVVTVLHISSRSETDSESQIAPFLLTVSVRKLTEEHLAGKWFSKTVTYLGDIIVVTQLSSREDAHRYTDTMDKICKMAKRICNARVTAGIGYVCDDMSSLKQSYQGAKTAVSYRVFYGNTKAINVAEIDYKEDSVNRWEESCIQKIVKKINIGDEESLKQPIDDFIFQLGRSKMSFQEYKLLIMTLLVELSRLCSNYQIEMDKVFGEKDIYSQLLKLESGEELGKVLKEKCVKMQQIALEKRQNTTISFVSKAQDYVKEHYSDDDISIETVCSYLNVSSSYFSTTFKKVTGKTFINYLTDYRMQQAVNLLEMSDEKTYAIGEHVGYSDPNYFSYVFKKQFGISPSKYRTDKLAKS